MTTSDKEVSIIIVNWNTCGVLLKCLESVRRNCSGMDYEVIVVDNASSDDSAERVRRDFPEAHVIENERNLGFATANNRGFAASSGRFILFLNSDTLIHPGAIEAMIDLFGRRPKAGCCGCKLLNGDGSLQESVTGMPSFGAMLYRYTMLKYFGLFKKARRAYKAVDFDYSQERPAEQVLGAVMMLPRSVLEPLGGMDGNLFLYFEDPDLCRRVRGAGYDVFYTPKGEITHLGGASSDHIGSAKLHGIFFRSMFYYFRKHHGRFCTFCFGLIFKPSVLLYMLWQGIIYTAGGWVYGLAGRHERMRARIRRGREALKFIFLYGLKFLLC